MKLDPHLPQLPSIGELLEHPRVKGVVKRINRTTLARRAAGFLDELRSSLVERAGRIEVPPVGQLAERLARRLLGEPASGTAIINATGVVVGDPELAPPLAEQAMHAVLQLAGDYHTRESPLRGAVEDDLCRLTDAEAVLVVSSFDGAVAMARGAAPTGACQVDVAPLAGLMNPERIGLAPVATIGERVAGGADMIVVDGAALLGGPACGLVIGRRRFVELAANHPWAPAMAADALTCAALHATVAAYTAGDDDAVMFHIPIWQLLSAPLANLQQRAERLTPLIAEGAGVAAAEVRLVDSAWAAGDGGPLKAPSWAIVAKPASGDAARVISRLSRGPHPVVAIECEGFVIADLRSVFPRWDQQLVAVLTAACE